MSIEKSLFGTLSCGKEVYAYTLTNKTGASVKIMDLGGTLIQLHMPDRDGKMADIICGYDTVESYMKAGGYQGALIGRYGNRIHNGQFTLNGKTYDLYKNEKDITHLHGGKVGFDKKIWDVVPSEDADGCKLTLSLVSPDGEENYPGTLKVTVVYTLSDDNALSIHYVATCDQDTVLNLTNHTYFNLGGYDSGDVLDQQIMIASEAYTEVDANCIPTGNMIPVEGTPFDLRKLTVIGDGIDADDQQIQFGGGYDHNFALKNDGVMGKAAEVYDPETGRCMEVFTNQPAVQFYAANMMNDAENFKGNVPQQPRHALCLETQTYPDAPNHPNFPTSVLKVGEIYDRTTIYKFSVK